MYKKRQRLKIYIALFDSKKYANNESNYIINDMWIKDR